MLPSFSMVQGYTYILQVNMKNVTIRFAVVAPQSGKMLFFGTKGPTIMFIFHACSV